MTKGKRWFGRRPGLFVNNSRFYILVFSILLSLFLLCYFRTTIVSSTLFLIRLQQVYGFISLAFLYLALIATPLGKVFGKEGFMKQFLYARRALGVSAAYFASLHMLVALFGQLGGTSSLGSLPSTFQKALYFGLGAFAVLLLMAATSFDKAVSWMTFPRWKWLHRLVYLSTIAIFLHVWIIGTHIEYAWVRWLIFLALELLVVLESWRLTGIIKKKSDGLHAQEIVTLFISLIVVFSAIIIILPKSVERYHELHADHQAARG